MHSYLYTDCFALQGGSNRDMLQAAIETRLTLYQSDILSKSYRHSQCKQMNF